MRISLRNVFLAVLILFLAVPCLAQAPAQLPGYNVSVTAGYSLLQGAQTNNGFFSSVAVPLWTRTAPTWTFNVAGRADYFSVVTPATFVIAGGVEQRFQFSRASFFNGRVFQPFVNEMLGAARSNCTAAPGSICDTKAHFALKLGTGLDMPLSSNVTARLFELDYIHSNIFPNNRLVLSNFAEITTGLGIRF